MSILAPGSMLGGCRLDTVVGRGGMGVVYRAHQLDLDRDVAVKVIAPHLLDDVETEARFLREARAASAVEHPNVVPVHAVGISDGRAYLVMRYIAGDDLRTRVARDGALDPHDAAEITARVGEALDAIHAAGYVHRDVKPRNVLLDRDGRVYLSDFGLAKEVLASAGPTTAEHWVGTLDYVAPEQIRGHDVDARADVYALGGVLYFMLTGRVPFDRPTDEAKLWAHLHDPPPAPSRARRGVPLALDAVVQGAMAKDPADRPRSAGALGDAARSAASGPDPPTATTVRVPAIRPPRRRHVWAGAVALVAVAAGAWLLVRDGPSADPKDRGIISPTPGARATPAKAETAGVGATIYGVGRRPRAVTVAAGAVWVLSIYEERITRLDAETGRKLRHQPFVGVGASAIASDAGKVWVTKVATSGVLRLDPRSGKLRYRIATPLPPARVAAGPSGLWVVVRADPDAPVVLLRYDRDADSGSTPLQIPFPEGVSAITEGGGAAWVALRNEPRIVRVGPDGRRNNAAWLPDPATALAYGRGRLWASVEDDGSVARIDPRNPGDVPVTDVGRHPAGIAVSGDRVFVADNTRHSVAVIDPARMGHGPVKRLRVALNPYAMAAGDGHVWVTGMGRGTATRIDP